MIVFWVILYLAGAEFTAALYSSTASLVGKPWTTGMGIVTRIAWPFALARMLGTMLAGTGL